MSTLQQLTGRRTQGSPLVPPTTDGAAVPQAAVARRRAIRRLVTGLVFFVVGLVITLVTYSHASSSPTGGTYVVAWGPMLFGLIRAVRGWHALRQANMLY